LRIELAADSSVSFPAQLQFTALQNIYLLKRFFSPHSNVRPSSKRIRGKGYDHLPRRNPRFASEPLMPRCGDT
jgi:hypothetical protein